MSGKTSLPTAVTRSQVQISRSFTPERSAASLTPWQPSLATLGAMNRTTARKSETLIKVYLGLLAVAVLLCGALAHRHIAGWFQQADVVQITAEPRDPAAQHGYMPTINWGGGKR